MGITLNQIEFHTTNDQWQKQYIDRTRPENKGKPMFKLLNIDSFGVYYKTHETIFVSKKGEDERKPFMQQEFESLGGKIVRYGNDYLLEPIQLGVRLI